MKMEKFMSWNRATLMAKPGLNPAINPAPSFAKRFQIRHGLGAMPSFDESLISDKELDNVLSYLKALKEN